MTLDFEMEKIVQDLKNIFQFKDDTREGDIVLVVGDDLLYAVVMDISRDETKRDEWWHVSLQLLAVPPQKVVWTLREPQFTGKEIFSMGGRQRYVKAVDLSGGQASRKEKGPAAKQPRKKPMLKVVK